MKETPDSDWFIISSKPKQEFDAEKSAYPGCQRLPAGLQQKDQEKQDQDRPGRSLFSGYLFAQFDLHEYYQKVKYTRGVKTILGYNEYLWTIADEKIRDIRSRESNGLVVLHKRENRFRKGDRILIDEGDFEGWEGIFQEELPDRERAIIMLTNVKFSSKLILPKKYLVVNR